jgi:uncharacterized lipoprotein YmbA
MNVAKPCISLVLWIAALGGCASAPPPFLLTLPPIDALKAGTPRSTAAPRVLAVRRPDVPAYLLSQRVRYRVDDSTLAEWPNASWAERIELSVARVFNEALHQRLPGWQLCKDNCSERTPALSLQVELTRMEYFRGERRLAAGARISLWSTERPPRLLHTEEHAYEVEGDADTPSSHARAISGFLDRVAGDAALALASPQLTRPRLGPE